MPPKLQTGNQGEITTIVEIHAPAPRAEKPATQNEQEFIDFLDDDDNDDSGPRRLTTEEEICQNLAARQTPPGVDAEGFTIQTNEENEPTLTNMLSNPVDQAYNNRKASDSPKTKKAKPGQATRNAPSSSAHNQI